MLQNSIADLYARAAPPVNAVVGSTSVRGTAAVRPTVMSVKTADEARAAALVSIAQRRDYGAAPRSPAEGPLSKRAERALHEGASCPRVLSFTNSFVAGLSSTSVMKVTIISASFT